MIHSQSGVAIATPLYRREMILLKATRIKEAKSSHLRL